MATRAIVYENNGDPVSVLSAVTLPPKPLSGRLINVKVLLSPINPSDTHVVHGSYAVQPTPRELSVNGEQKFLRLPGNEGLGEITEVGPEVKGLKKGDWVLFIKGLSGTWSSAQVLEEKDVLKLDKASGISAVNASTLTVSRSTETLAEVADSRNLQVNPVTAHKMLSTFVDLKPGDWIAQNAGNSAVNIFSIHSMSM